VPLSLSLPAGLGGSLVGDIKELLEGIKADIPKALDSKEYEGNKAKILEAYQQKNTELFGALEKEAEGRGFDLQRAVSGLVMVPRRRGATTPRRSTRPFPRRSGTGWRRSAAS